MSRKVARESTMKLLYEMEMNKEFSEEKIEDFLSYKDYTKNEVDYIKDIAENFIEKKDKIDELIDKNVKNWSLDRLSKVDLSILRIAVYEIYYRADIPKEVSINEAVEIAKKYSTDESSKFINGILGGLVESL